jgi:hypothetical protein
MKEGISIGHVSTVRKSFQKGRLEFHADKLLFVFQFLDDALSFLKQQQQPSTNFRVRNWGQESAPS